MVVKILKMKESDLNQIYKIAKNHFTDVGDEWLTMDYLKNSFKPNNLSYVAKIDGKIVGGIIMILEDIVKNWVRFIIVDKNYRKMGIGSKLLKEVTNHLKYGESIFVDTGITDKSAIAFYEKNGFINRGRVSSLYEKCPGYIFEKVIK